MKADRNTDKTFEDYLEAMLVLKERNSYVRSIDVAAYLNVTKPSVTYTTKRLKDRGYITMDEDNLITITEEGMKIASRTYDRHKMLSKFFIELGVDEEVAKEDACKVEHDISQETFEALCRYVEKHRSSEG